MTEKDLLIYQAITQVLTVFAETEIGTNVNLNNEVICSYLNSDDSIADYFDAHTIDECFDIFTTQILNGYPVWRMLDLPEWTLQQLEKEFRDELDREEEEQKRKYKCLTCAYFSEIQCAFGVLRECKRPIEADKDSWRHMHKRKEPLELKETCDYYIHGNPYLHYATLS